ncbi:hypothetical protein [Mycolicibacterium mengxianglii]|uniref:hypothetical protein n=1 Tax=Mycolicibacterium mengxianglii TaxID=2736649 RepID=UPI001E41E8B2|nr:hypothetical protein [Mycolicibacterium mengxianglii]
MTGVNLLPTPDVAIADADVADALSRAVRIIGPLLDVLWGTDPLQVKRRSGRGDGDSGPVHKVADGIGRALNAAEVPGTRAWDQLDTDARIHWWVRRIGALNTVAVAFPGFLGVLANRLPIQDLLGFTNQAVILCAVARELGVTDHDQQVRLLAAVLCGRDLSAAPGSRVSDPMSDPMPDIPRNPAGIAKAVWKLVGLLNAISEELAKRPHPRAPFRYLSMLPVVGAVAAYFGEIGALQRAAGKGRKWIAGNLGQRALQA